jgi:hypothetical protein
MTTQVLTGLPICANCKHGRVQTDRPLLGFKFWLGKEIYGDPYIFSVDCLRFGFHTDPCSGEPRDPEDGIDATGARNNVELCGLHARFYEPKDP